MIAVVVVILVGTKWGGGGGGENGEKLPSIFHIKSSVSTTPFAESIGLFFHT